MSVKFYEFRNTAPRDALGRYSIAVETEAVSARISKTNDGTIAGLFYSGPTARSRLRSDGHLVELTPADSVAKHGDLLIGLQTLLTSTDGLRAQAKTPEPAVVEPVPAGTSGPAETPKETTSEPRSNNVLEPSGGASERAGQ